MCFFLSIIMFSEVNINLSIVGIRRQLETSPEEESFRICNFHGVNRIIENVIRLLINENLFVLNVRIFYW